MTCFWHLIPTVLVLGTIYCFQIITTCHPPFNRHSPLSQPGHVSDVQWKTKSMSVNLASPLPWCGLVEFSTGVIPCSGNLWYAPTVYPCMYQSKCWALLKSKLWCNLLKVQHILHVFTWVYDEWMVQQGLELASLHQVGCVFKAQESLLRKKASTPRIIKLRTGPLSG